jgi:general secretion pathway protein G
MKNKKISIASGFTLVELLVSVSIIGILSAFLIVNLNGFRARARDTERKKDMLEIQNALELYRADAGTYPTTAGFPNCGSSLTVGTNVYMKKILCDPLPGPAWGANYLYASSGSNYTITACLENANDAQKDAAKVAGCASAQASMTLSSPN